MLPFRGHRAGNKPLLTLVAAVMLTLGFLLPRMTEAAPNRANERRFQPPNPKTIDTNLYQIQLLGVALAPFADSGGAIEPVGDSLLVATPRGRIAQVHSDGQVTYLPQKAPMFDSAPEAPINWIGFRVADILLNKQSTGRYTLFVSHHHLADDCVEFRISSTTLALENEQATITGGWKTEFTATPCIEKAVFGHWEGDIPKIGGGIQAGGKMLMDGAGHLLVAVGDHAMYEWHERQTAGDAGNRPIIDPDSHLGKLVRIELATGSAAVVAGGFRNPQGLARDGEGNLWQTEHGPQGGDELNLVKPGRDYGWPFVTYGVQYGNRVWPYSDVPGRHDGYEEPVFAWAPSIGISSLIVGDSRLLPLWQDDLLIGSLRDRSLFRVRVRDGRATSIEKIRLGERIRDIAQMADGRVALLTDSSQVLFLRRAPLFCQNAYDPKSIYSYDAGELCIDLFGIIGEEVEPAIASLFDVFAGDGWLIYRKSPCSEADLKNRFFLHISPSDSGALSEETREHGVNVYDFSSTDAGVHTVAVDNRCLVARSLPAYAIRRISTGQVIEVIGVEGAEGVESWDRVWAAEYRPGPPPAEIEDALEVEAPPAGAALFAVHCATCHNLTAEHSIGPHLEGVIGRQAGSVDGFNASSTLAALEIVWSGENMAEFIFSPSRFASGTSMADVGVTEEEAQLIAEFLAAKR